MKGGALKKHRKGGRAGARPPMEAALAPTLKRGTGGRDAAAAPAAHTAAANEYAERAPEDQRALLERVKQAGHAPRPAVQNLGEIVASTVRPLSQALRLDDRRLLDDILKETPPLAVGPTAQRLDAAEGLELLTRCTQVFQAQPERAAEVIPWIKEVVKAHAVFLMAQPEVAALLAPVQYAIREHLGTMSKLLLLEGRLDLVLSRLPGSSEVRVPPVAPLVTFAGDLLALQPTAPAPAGMNGTAARGHVIVVDDDDDDDDDDDGDVVMADGDDDDEDDAGSLHDSLPDQTAASVSSSDDDDEEEEEGDDGPAPDDLRSHGA